MRELKTQFDLMQAVANHLTGRQVIVRMQTPVTTNSLGTVQIKADGVPVVDIDPGLGQWTMHTFLHELAHVKLHAGQMVRSNLDQAKPQTITVNKMDKRPTWEVQADELRDHWMNYAKAHSDPTLSGDEGILWALMNWSENNDQNN